MPKPGKVNNPHGRPEGSKNVKTQQWESLADSITGRQADQFNEFMGELWNGDRKDRYMAAELYLKVLNYFKPKFQSVDNSHNFEGDPLTIITPPK